MRILKQLICFVCLCALLSGMIFTAAFAGEENARGEGSVSKAQQLLSGMNMDEKISQMIIPAIRTWNEEKVTDLSAVPELAQSLQKHQYCGIILYGSNVSGTEQVFKLVSDLQANNAAIEGVSAHIPYLMALDEEGGVVTRLTTGTRMTGSMAISATGAAAADNAVITGEVIGKELAVLGFHTGFAPDIDVNNNAANPVIGTRSFSDDPNVVSQLGTAYARGLMSQKVIPTFKHYPGHGDTGTDSHIGTPSVEKTYEQITQTELVPFKAAISEGADLIMTAHITYPQIDEEVVFGDGETKGYYPATMSKKIITDILRTDLGFEGVVITDALEMDAIRTAKLVPGEENSVDYAVNIAEKVINAGVDILLLPLDMKNADATAFYDAYISGLQAKVAEGVISQARIDESVLRILKLKEKYGILDPDASGTSMEEKAAKAAETVGAGQNHDAEMKIALQAITLLKNNDAVLPIAAQGKKIIFACRQAEDCTSVLHTLGQLQEKGVIDPDAKIVNLANGESTGKEDAATRILIDYYYNPNGEDTKLHYTQELKDAAADADLVICVSKIFNAGALQPGNDQYIGISSLISDVHAGKGKAVLLSSNLPYDAARYQDADAILLAYMGSGTDMDPTARADGSANLKAYNANMVAAIRVLFGDASPMGTLPVNIPAMEVKENAGAVYTDEILYERGFGLHY